MKIHTRKRAIFMRSVDRRNDSFGADTEGFALSSQRKAQITRRNAVSAQEPKKFALSSQRKLSVLLVVGIVILSAKECEMGPGGDGDKPVTFDYICTNGTKAEGTAEAENTEQCTACNTGFELTSDSQCVVELFDYICTNGTVAEGTTGTENTEKCSACASGFGLNAANACVDVPPAVVTLTASLPTPLVGTVKLDWSEPTDADFSHLLISYTPDPPAEPIQVNTGTTTTIIGASGLTSGTPYIFTAKSVDTTGNESAASSGATATPVSCPTVLSVLFATTDGTTSPASVNVASGSGTAGAPYLIPLVNGLNPACPIVIELDHSGEDIVANSEHFRIDNMPTGASYTSHTLAWTYKSASALSNTGVQFREDGATPTIANPRDPKEIRTLIDHRGAMVCGVSADGSCAMSTKTNDVDIMPTGGRTVAFGLINPTVTDSLTVTLTP